MKVHPAAELFPMMTDTELDELAQDVQQNGLINSIVLHDGKVLDGRNRLVACERVGVEPVFTEYTGDDPIGFVVSLNLRRRHLTREQRGELIVKLRGAGWTQQRIAQEVGVTQKTVSVTLADDVIPKYNVPDAIIDTLGRRQPTRKPRAVRTLEPRELSEEELAVFDPPERTSVPASHIIISLERLLENGALEWDLPDADNTPAISNALSLIRRAVPMLTEYKSRLEGLRNAV